MEYMYIHVHCSLIKVRNAVTTKGLLPFDLWAVAHKYYGILWATTHE